MMGSVIIHHHNIAQMKCVDQYIFQTSREFILDGSVLEGYKRYLSAQPDGG